MRHQPTCVLAIAVSLILFTCAIPKAEAGYSLIRSFAPQGDGTYFVGVAFNGSVYAATDGMNDLEDRTIQIFSTDGTYQGHVLQGEAPNSVAADSSGNVYLGDGFGGIVVSTTGTTFLPVQFTGGFFSVATDIFQNVWTTDAASYVNQYAPDGSLVNRTPIPGGGRPTGVAVDPQFPELAYIAVASSSGDHILRFTFESGYDQFGASGNGNGELSIGGVFAGGLAADALSRVYVADAGNHRVQIFDGLSGQYISQFAVPGYPTAVAVDPTGDNVWVVDYENDLVRQFSLVPEPASVSLILLAIAALSCSGYRRFKKSLA